MTPALSGSKRLFPTRAGLAALALLSLPCGLAEAPLRGWLAGGGSRGHRDQRQGRANEVQARRVLVDRAGDERERTGDGQHREATLRPKKEFQSKNSSRIPVPNRPRTAPPPATPTQTPMARGRSASGNEVVITERVVGMIAAAPTPMNTRTTMRCVGSVVTIPTAAAAPKTTRPMRSRPLRP